MAQVDSTTPVLIWTQQQMRDHVYTIVFPRIHSKMKKIHTKKQASGSLELSNEVHRFLYETTSRLQIDSIPADSTSVYHIPEEYRIKSIEKKAQLVIETVCFFVILLFWCFCLI